MSVQKLLLVSAVPFGLARFQSNATKTIINMTGGVGTSQSTDRTDIRILPNLRKHPSNANLRMIKKRNKIHNRLPVKISQEKIKLQKDFIKQHLLDLKSEKIKLMLENEDLKIRCSSLEEENQSLRMQLQNSQIYFQEGKNQMCEGTLKHASLVNIPQLKDWVHPQILTILMISLGEMFSSIQLKELISFHLWNLYQMTSKYMKSVISLTGLMKQMMCLSALSHKTFWNNPRVLT